MDYQQREPAYDAVIPGEVRYDKRLSPIQKLLYAEIRALSGRYGYCFATNAYFAELFYRTDRTISRMIAKLADCGYIQVEICKDDLGQIVARKIYINVANGCARDIANPDVSDHKTKMSSGGENEDGNASTHTTKISGGIDKNVRSFKCININTVNIPPISPKDKDSAARMELEAWARKNCPNQCDALIDRLNDFCDSRLNRKKPCPLTPGRAVTILTNKLMRYSGGDVRVMLAILDKSILCGWTGVFPPKPDDLKDLDSGSAPGAADEDGVPWV